MAEITQKQNEQIDKVLEAVKFALVEALKEGRSAKVSYYTEGANQNPHYKPVLVYRFDIVQPPDDTPKPTIICF